VAGLRGAGGVYGVDGAFGGVDVGGRLGGAKFLGNAEGSVSTGKHPRLRCTRSSGEPPMNWMITGAPKRCLRRAMGLVPNDSRS
jgi:hypothetical protein